MTLHTLRYLGALVAMNLKASLALRGVFWLQAGLMALNDLMFFCVWWIFFARIPEVRGWGLHDMYVSYGLVALSFGVFAVLLGGTRDLATRALAGELDTLLPQPRAILPRMALSRSSASGWGDVAFGLLLVLLSGYVTWERAPALLLLCFSGALILAATAVLANSMVFFLGELENLPRQIVEFTITFSMYPSPLFTGALRVVLFTLLPAGFIGFLPAEFFRNPSWGPLLATLGGAVAYVSLAVWVFGQGLKRYESGSRVSTFG